MEWEAPAVVLEARPLGEADLLVTVMTEEHGRHLGLARGGQSRRQAPLWQAGNLMRVRWLGRLAEQLGTISGEVVHATGAFVMEDALALDLLRAACAVADGALPEREAHPAVFAGLVALLARVGRPEEVLADYVRWEVGLLGELGYGLDFSGCPVTGTTVGLAYVSPRTGRAVSREGAGQWAHRLLPLPGFLVGGNIAEAPDWAAGLLLTGHFLGRDAFGAHHKPLPAARHMLYERVAAMVDTAARESEPDDAG